MPVEERVLWKRLLSFREDEQLLSDLRRAGYAFAKPLLDALREGLVETVSRDELRQAIRRFRRRWYVDVFAELAEDQTATPLVVSEEPVTDAVVAGSDVGFRKLAVHYSPAIFVLNAAYCVHDYRNDLEGEVTDADIWVGSQVYHSSHLPRVFAEQLEEEYERLVRYTLLLDESEDLAQSTLVEPVGLITGREQAVFLSEVLAAYAGVRDLGWGCDFLYALFDRPLHPLHIRRFRVVERVIDDLKTTFERAFRYLKSEHIEPIGVSYASTRAFVNTLALSLCQVRQCKGCALAEERVEHPPSDPEDWGIEACPLQWFGERLNDGLLFRYALTQPGMRSPAFRIYSELYSREPPPYLTFYLKMPDDNVLRVEVFEQTPNSENLQRYAHLVYTDALAGKGYHHVLGAADTLSRISLRDRDLVLNQVNHFMDLFVQRGLRVTVSRKELLKQRKSRTTTR